MLSLTSILVGGLALTKDLSQDFRRLTGLQTSISFKHEPTGFFNWTEINPSKHLKWHNCYEAHECARLEVPLNWQDTKGKEKAAIAIVRLPAKVSRNDPKFGGSILLNPGGPGGPGVDFARWSAWEIQANVDGKKHFEIIGFDSRGVGNTVPSSSCFETELDRQAFLLKLGTVGDSDASEAAFTAQWQAAKAFGEACSRTTTKHLTTLDVVHDMVAIIDALDPKNKKPLLNYWGFSYGTYLGNTFASAFPDRVGRMVLDGVLDPDLYRQVRWNNSLINTEDVLRYFYSSCWQAGPEKCPLAEENLNNIILKVENLFESLKQTPLPVTFNGTVDFVTYTDVRHWLFQALYTPTEKFPRIARQLYDLLNGNTTSSAESMTRLKPPLTRDEIRNRPPMKASVHSRDNEKPPLYPQLWDVSRLIACTDGDYIGNRTTTEHKKYLDDMIKQSPHFGGMWIDLPTYCVHFPERLRPHESSRYTGEFGSKLKDYSEGASPILWIGNEADPVCPAAHAYSQAERHEGSVVLKVMQFGHCSGPGNPNKCTYAKVRKFFNEGVLPPVGERLCAGELDPWSGEK